MGEEEWQVLMEFGDLPGEWGRADDAVTYPTRAAARAVAHDLQRSLRGMVGSEEWPYGDCGTVTIIVVPANGDPQSPDTKLTVTGGGAR